MIKFTVSLDLKKLALHLRRSQMTNDSLAFDALLCEAPTLDTASTYYDTTRRLAGKTLLGNGSLTSTSFRALGAFGGPDVAAITAHAVGLGCQLKPRLDARCSLERRPRCPIST